MAVDRATLDTLAAPDGSAVVAPSPEPVHSAREREAVETRGGRRRLAWDKKRTAELFRRYKETGEATARDEIITMYLNLVKYLAGKFRNRGEPIEDLVQVGMIGLIKAVDRFEPERGLEFTTYATPTIIGEIKRHFRDKGWAIRIPRRLQELSAQVSRAIDALTQEHQRSPIISEIAEHIGVSVDDVLRAMESSEAYNSVSLDGGRSGDESDNFSILDHVGADDHLMRVADDRATLAAALKELTPLEQQVLYLRFYAGLTQTEIATQLTVSQMQVSRLLRRTLTVLRNTIAKDGATPR